MPLKEIDRRYREKNREKLLLDTGRKWSKKNKEYKENNKEKIDEDLSAVYDFLIEQTHCMICYKEFKDSLDRHLDQDHQTGEIRYICCRYCNVHLLR